MPIAAPPMQAAGQQGFPDGNAHHDLRCLQEFY
jgi:hypothetical protein